MIPKYAPASIKHFIADTKQIAKTNGIDIYFGKGKTINAGAKTKVGGYFCDADNKLAVATGKPLKKWIELLVHETCHMDQWIENSSYWDNLDEHILAFDTYILGGKVDNINEAVNAVVTMEADCERRAVKKILAYGLPLDTARYSQQANAYLLSHKAIIYYKRWYKVSPYKRKATWSSLPTVLSAPHTYRIENNKTDPTFFKSCF